MEKRQITVEDVIDLCNGNLICGNLNSVLENFSKDTREIKPGDVYIGIKGEKYDGNEMYEQAFQNGASICILQDVIIPEHIKEKYFDKTIILVEDTVLALQKLATFKRNMYDIPVVAVTGSVGKTSTKDIIASVMEKKFHVLKTEGNFNSQVGLPLTVLRLKDHNAMVIELGMNQLGEISRLTNIAKPTVAVITNIGTAHIGILGSRENILKAKLEILEGLQNGGKVIINNDNDLLHKWHLGSSNDGYNVLTYGIENVSDIMAYHSVLDENGSQYDVDMNGKTYHVNVSVGGNHFISNSLCAISVGKLFDIPMEDILDGIAKFELTKRRMQVEKLPDNVIIINDCYNANYDSMKAAIEYLGKLDISKKIAVLGDMFELGDYSEEFHRKVGQEVANNKIDILIAVGTESRYMAESANQAGIIAQDIYTCDDNQGAISILKSIVEHDTAILIKASNGMNFQEIFNAIMCLDKRGEN